MHSPKMGFSKRFSLTSFVKFDTFLSLNKTPKNILKFLISLAVFIKLILAYTLHSRVDWLTFSVGWIELFLNFDFSHVATLQNYIQKQGWAIPHFEMCDRSFQRAISKFAHSLFYEERLCNRTFLKSDKMCNRTNAPSKWECAKKVRILKSHVRLPNPIQKDLDFNQKKLERIILNVWKFYPVRGTNYNYYKDKGI